MNHLTDSYKSFSPFLRGRIDVFSSLYFQLLKVVENKRNQSSKENEFQTKKETPHLQWLYWKIKCFYQNFKASPSLLKEKEASFHSCWFNNPHTNMLFLNRIAQLAFKDSMIHKICNSHYLSHFATFFIDTRTKRSAVDSCTCFQLVKNWLRIFWLWFRLN